MRARSKAGPGLRAVGGVGPRARSASPGDQACCCPARAAVRVVMPPSPVRPHPTDLLLCAHHFRMSRRALMAVQAAVCELPETSRYAAGQPGHVS
ncbi:MAG TPA: hypothetical protein VFV73_36165 [Streptosporangiaceae bacterium]|nr:hypothetical protein [Streptosporangiaceae bacterium]